MNPITVSATCPFCGQKQHTKVDLSGFLAWRSGVLIQDALPELSADDRELLLTGICQDCWPKEEENDDG